MWIHTDSELKRILKRTNNPDNERQSVANSVRELVPHLRLTHCYSGLDERILTDLEAADTFHSFNRALDAIYNYADRKRIWLGFMEWEE